jgi:hypothetical protein
MVSSEGLTLVVGRCMTAAPLTKISQLEFYMTETVRESKFILAFIAHVRIQREIHYQALINGVPGKLNPLGSK